MQYRRAAVLGGCIFMMGSAAAALPTAASAVPLGISDDGAMLAPGGVAWAHDQGLRDVRFMVHQGDEARYDAAVADASRLGRRVLVVMVNRPDADTPAYAQRLVRRWPGMDVLSVGNEVNYSVSPCAYGERYAAVRSAVRELSRIPVLYGELAPAQGGDGHGMAPMDFLRAATRCSGPARRADGIAIHPYQFSDPLSPGRADWLGIGRTPRLKRWLTHNRAARRTFKRSLWLTEFGYPRHYQPDQEQAAAWWPRAKMAASRVKARTLIAQGAVTTGGRRNWDSAMPHGLLASVAAQ